ncbi:MAG: N-6 DNA methylase [Acidobacteria bacterium]|nr:N-6 DNA methylase [Acidobacteriota bacterium]
MHSLETYLKKLAEIRSAGAGVKETSYYPALDTLLNEVGKDLKPKVRCILQLANRGAGLPDGGLFSAEQLDKRSRHEALPGQIPSRGVIEVKPTSDDAWITADSEQVTRYWDRYRQVLATNYRDFILVARDAEGKPAKLEPFRLAESEAAFWVAAETPRATANRLGQRFTGYLQRVMLHSAQLAAPEDVAWFLASYARDAKARIEGVELPALAAVREALEEALGLKFEGEKGERFFRSSLVQTLFYGVFSAWVLWAKQHSPQDKARFEWYSAARYLHVPMISKLFYLIAEPSQLKTLGIAEVLDWTDTVLNRVDRRSFFEKFQEAHAVQYFYEPFLEAFDPELRKELGVWYTPPEIVKYMVERVDMVLRKELNLADGLADKNVYVLDPCCGTGSYLVEVLDRIHRTLQKRGGDALTAGDLKEAAQRRVFGFEILPAPFVISHLQLGLFLQRAGAPLSDGKHERAGVYLTNALTGWEPPKEPKTHLMFSELEAERDAAEEVKREKPILVVLGNPPYNAFAGVSPAEEQGLVEPYKEGLVKEWGIKKFNLDELYVRFFRLAERRIAEMTGQGIVCYISNFSYLSEPSFVVMRRRFLEDFDRLWIDCMNGDSRETGKLTPERKADPSVFSTEYNREGIRKGTAVALMVRRSVSAHDRSVRFRHFWGTNKRRDLLDSLKEKEFDANYQSAKPAKENRFSFRPSTISAEYSKWPKLPELPRVSPFNGPVERRGNSLVVFESLSLLVLRDYLDVSKSDEEIRAIAPRFMKSSGEFKAEKTRKALAGLVDFDSKQIVRYPFKPFDIRYCYLDGNIQPLFSRPSPELLDQREIPGNSFFITRDTADKDPEGPPFYFSRLVCDYDCISGHARHFPMQVFPGKPLGTPVKESRVPLESGVPVPNLSPAAIAYLRSVGIQDSETEPEMGELVWMNCLSVGFAPAYLNENAAAIRQDWPRIPLPDSKDLLVASAELGRQVAALLDTEAHVKEVTSGEIRAELKLLAVASRVGGGSLKEDELAVTAGWGHRGKGGVVMPGKGKLIERDYTSDERAAIEEGAKALGLSSAEAFAQLGERVCDAYLNDAAYWSGVPVKVWEYTVGGYQVMKKWLSYREAKILGRAMTKDEVREVRDMARRIAAIVLLQPALDRNYAAVKANTFPWPPSEPRQ